MQFAQKALDLARQDSGVGALNRAILGTNLAVALSHTEDQDRTVAAFVDGWKAFGQRYYLTDEALDHVRAFVHYLAGRELWHLASSYLIPCLDIARKIKADYADSYDRTLRAAAMVYQAQSSPMLETIMNEQRAWVESFEDFDEHFEKLLDLARFWEELSLFHAAMELLQSVDLSSETHLALQAKKLYTLGNVYYELGELEQSEGVYLKALALFKKHSDLCDASAISALNNYALLLTRLDRWPAAKSVLQQSLALIPNVQDDIDFTHKTILVNLAHVCSHLAEYKPAVEFLLQALAHPQGYGIEVLEQKADLCDRLSILYEKLGDYKSLVEIAKRGKSYLRELRANAIYGESAFLARAANACFELGQNKDALEFYQMALVQVEGDVKSRDEDYKIAYGNVGMAFERLGDWQSARQYYSKAWDKIGQSKIEDKAIYGLHLVKSKLYTTGAVHLMGDLQTLQHWLEQMEACPLWLQLELRELGAEVLKTMGAQESAMVHVMDRNLEEIRESVEAEDQIPFMLHQIEVGLKLGLVPWCRSLCAELEKKYPLVLAKSEAFQDFKARLA